MARTGFETTITPGGSQGDSLHAFLDTNLTTWSVGSIVTFEEGTNYERVFFVLSSTLSNAEILVFMGQGGYGDPGRNIHSSGYYENDQGRTESTTEYDDLAFWLSSAPEGGFYNKLYTESASPSNASFFDGYPSFLMMAMDGWEGAQGAQRLYAIEDDTTAELILYCVDDAGGNDYAMFLYSDQAFVQGPMIGPARAVAPEGQIVIAPRDTNAPAERSLVTSLYIDGARNTWKVHWRDWHRCSNINDGNTPTADMVATSRVLERSEVTSVVRGEYNPDLIKTASRQSSFHKSILTDSGGRKFVFLFKDLLTPWDEQGLPQPS